VSTTPHHDTVAPHGTWPSPITAEAVVAASVGIGEVRVDGDDVWWSESRPEEGGRVALVRRAADGTVDEVLAAPWSARTCVHEYGGGAWWVHAGTVWFASWADQRLHRLDPDDPAPRPITPEPPTPGAWRYADGVVSPDGRWIVCVRERHDLGPGPAEVVNELVALPADGSDPPTTLWSDADFVAAPRLDPRGDRLAWLSWDHPRMPWDGTDLHVAVASLDHPEGPRLSDARVVAGGPDESLVQPDWTAAGDLLVVSDRSDWWNLHRVAGLDDEPGLEPIAPTDAEIGTPPWVFAMSRWARLDDGRLVVAVAHAGLDHLGVIEPGSDRIDELATPFTAISSVRAAGDAVVVVAASPTTEPSVVRVAPHGDADPEVEVLRSPRDLGLDPAWFAHGHPVSFPTTGGRTAHALFYPPTNPEVRGPGDQRPPLVVMIHGGPTAAARPQLSLATQFWTSRGFAVVDVNYGGSTGYGRRYRRQLDGAWGVVDVDDCVAAAEHLARAGLVDGERLLIRGGSAGGFTTLAALAFRDVFAAGASHYGVADLAVLARDTHKFESRYLDGLVGPWPAAADRYAERSPILHVDRLDRPLIVFQGLDDPIVPPNQAEMIVAALRGRGVPVAYVPFAGEQHGFRQAANIRRALEAELWFYGRVLGFTPADDIEPVELLGP